MATIVEILQERAEEKLDREIKQYLESIVNNRFYTTLKQIKVEVDGSTETFWHFFFHNSTAHKIIFKDHIDSMVTEVSNEFLDKLESSDIKGEPNE